MTDENQTRKEWLNQCMAGSRSPLDHLTDAERAVLLKLREAGYDLVRTCYNPRYIRRRAA